MKEKKYNILKAVSWYTIGNILIKGVSFFVLPIFTSLMSTTEYGIYSIYNSYLAIFETIVLLGLSSTVRIAKYTKNLNYDKYMSTIVWIPPILTMILGLVVNLFLSRVDMILSMPIELWNFLFVTAATAAISNIISAKLVIDGNYKVYMLYSLIYTFGSIGISILLCYTVFRHKDVYMARVIGNCIANLLAVIFLLLKTKIKFYIDKNNFKISMVWGIPLLFHTVASVVLTQSDRIIINMIKGYSPAGVYSIAVTIIALPMILQSSFESAWSPWFYNKLDEKDYVSIRKVNNIYIVAFAVIIAEFMLVCPEIIHIFTNESYWDSVYSLIPLAVSVFCEMLYCLPVNVEYYNKKTNYILAGTLITVVINITLDFLFISLFGYIGAAYATTVSKLLLFLCHCHLVKKIDNNAVYNKEIVVVTLLILSVINVFAVLTVKYILIRFLLFFSIGAIALLCVMKNREMIMNYFKKGN